MRSVVAAVLFFVSMSSGLSLSSARADECVIDRDIVRCGDWQLEWIRPEGWELSEQTSYPGILVAAVHRRGGGRMTLAAQALRKRDETVEQYAARNRKALKAVGFQVGRLTQHATGALIHEAAAPDGSTAVRQGYFVRDGIAYVVTLAAPRYVMRSYVRAFDDSLRNVSFEKRAAPAPATADGEPDDQQDDMAEPDDSEAAPVEPAPLDEPTPTPAPAPTPTGNE